MLRSRLNIILLCFLCATQLLAEPLKPDFIDWTASPEQTLQSLKSRGVEAKLVGFHKTGVPYIRAKLSTLGNLWDATIYFDENDHPNQLLLQLDDVTRSGVNRIQKLAVGDFGKSYTVKHGDGEIRKDTFFTWEESSRTIVLDSADYKGQDNSTVWLKIRPTDK